MKAVLGEIGVGWVEQADALTVTLPGTLEALPILERCREFLYAFEVLQGTMDDAFLAIIGKEQSL